LRIKNRYWVQNLESEAGQQSGLEAQPQELAFNVWHQSLTEAELTALTEGVADDDALLPATRKTLKARRLRRHFNEHLWPGVRCRLTTDTASEPF
jgi:hypothetical protein